jgi:membrane-associated phospholipid phosphatase
MNIISQILDFDRSLLLSVRGFISPDYALLVQIAWELVVIYCAIFLVILWLYWVYIKNDEYKKYALSIFFTIVVVFVIYAIINLGIPKWRLWAMEIPGAIAPLIPHPADNSFPSGHALFSWALLFWIFSYFRRSWILILTIILSLITLAARVIWWVHYPGDIIAWFAFGILGAYFLQPIVRLLISKFFLFFIRLASLIRL